MSADRKRARELLEAVRSQAIRAAFELDALASPDPYVQRAIVALTVEIGGAAIKLLDQRPDVADGVTS